MGQLSDLLQEGVDHVLQACILEATLLGLGERRSDSEGDDDIIGVLGLTASQGQSVEAKKLGWTPTCC